MANKQCNWIHEPPHDKAGCQCIAYCIDNSTFCYLHSGYATDLLTRRHAMQARRKKVQEELDNDVMEIENLEDFRKFLVLLINGGLSGALKRDKMGMIAMVLPWLHKVLTQMRTTGQTTVRINKETKIAVISPGMLDDFLTVSDNDAIKMLQDAKDGKFAMEQKGDRINISTSQKMFSEQLQVPTKEIAKLAREADLSVKQSEIVDLFGEFYGDSEKYPVGMKARDNHPVQDVSGFGHLFETKGLPIEAQPRNHDYKPQMEDLGNNIGQMWYVCKGCGHKSHRHEQGVCKSPLPPVYEDDQP